MLPGRSVQVIVFYLSFIQYTIPLGTSAAKTSTKKARSVKAGSHNLHYDINDLNIAGRWDYFLRSSHLCATDSEDYRDSLFYGSPSRPSVGTGPEAG